MSDELATCNYNALRFFPDNYYGLKQEHRIDSEDRKGDGREGTEILRKIMDRLSPEKKDAKTYVEETLGVNLQWNRGDDIKSSKLFIQLNNVSIENESDWLQMANFHAEWSKKFFDVIVPYILQEI